MFCKKAARLSKLNYYSQTCHLNFFPTLSEFEDSFGRISVLEDDEEITQKQVMEDIQIYGSRPEPPEAIEVDEDTRIAEMTLPPKRNAAQFEEAVDRPAKIRKKGESKTYNYQAVTAMDWNSGASPLGAWLNQSAIPYTAPTVGLHEKKGSSRKDSVAQEIEEIKVFRNVHMAIAPEPVTGQYLLAIDAVAELEVNAQIYYRNIVDRYPDLPSDLALRLARANRDRAERLRQQKIRGQSSQIPSDLDGEDYHGNITSPAPQTMMGKLNASIFNAQKKHKCKICDKLFNRAGSLQTHMYIIHTGEKRKQESSRFISRIC